MGSDLKTNFINIHWSQSCLTWPRFTWPIISIQIVISCHKFVVSYQNMNNSYNSTLSGMIIINTKNVGI